MKKKFTFLLALSFLIVLISGKPIVSKPSAAQTSETSSVIFEVGKEEYVFGPNGAYPDIHFTTIKTKDGLQGFNGGLGCAYRFKGQTLETLTYDGSINGFCKGPSGSFDDCGVRLGPVYQVDDDHWIAWYHAEKCTPSASNPNSTRHSVAYAESFDGGPGKANY